MRATATRREAGVAKSASADQAFSNEASTSANSSFILTTSSGVSGGIVARLRVPVRRRQNPASVIPVTFAARRGLRKLGG